MRKDLIASALLLLIAGGYYLASLDIPSSTLEDEVGPTGLPNVLTVVMMFLALCIGARALIMKPQSVEAAPKPDEKKIGEAPWLHAMGMLLLVASYIPLAEIVGYFLALFVIISGVAMYEGLKPSPKLFLVAVCGAGFFWLLFVQLLGVRQPAGMLF